jgi:small-conductance mechanosensitive channel
VVGLEHLSIFGTDSDPSTLTGSCTSDPGVACRLVWDVSHNGRAATLTSEFLAGPVHWLLQVSFAVLLSLFMLWLVHRVINRLTARAEQSLLPSFRVNGNGSQHGPDRTAGGRWRRRLVPERVRPRRSPTDDSIAQDAAAARAAGGAGIPAVSAVQDTVPADTVPADTGLADTGLADTGLAGAATADQESVNIAAAQAETGMVDERRKQRVRALGSVLNSIASILIVFIGGYIVLGDFGIDLAPLLASAGVVGVAIGFGAQSLVKDYLSGIFMLVEDQYGVGDVITVGNATGTVENVTLRLTRMRDVNGIVWHIRNGSIDTVANESQGWARAVVDFPVPFASDLGRIRAVLTQVNDELWNDPAWRPVLLEAPEVWGAQQITSTEVTMRIVVKTAPLRQWEVEREMRARVKHALKEAAIMPAPVPTPQMAVTLTRSE